MGLIIGILFFISGLPQIWKIIRTKSAKDISVTMYIITAIAMLLTIIKASEDGSTQLIISTGISLITVLISIFLTLIYA